MIALSPIDPSPEEWNARVGGFPGASLVQTWEYGAAKARGGPWRVERVVFSDGGRPIGAAQVLIRRLPAGLPSGLAWINRAPLAEGAAQGAALAAIRRCYAEDRGFYVRCQPAIEASALAADVLSAAGFMATGTAGWASAALDLAFPVETLRAGLAQKWRNMLNKAERSDVTIESGGSAILFDEFLAAYRELLATRGFATTVTPEFLAALRDVMPTEGRLATFVARRAGNFAGAVLIARLGDVAEYLAGVVGEAGRPVGAGQLLLWRAVTAMRDAGIRRFDVGGLDPELTPAGIRHFKEGLGARSYRLAGEVESTAGGVLASLVRWRVRAARRAA